MNHEQLTVDLNQDTKSSIIKCFILAMGISEQPLPPTALIDVLPFQQRAFFYAKLLDQQYSERQVATSKAEAVYSLLAVHSAGLAERCDTPDFSDCLSLTNYGKLALTKILEAKDNDNNIAQAYSEIKTNIVELTQS